MPHNSSGQDQPIDWEEVDQDPNLRVWKRNCEKTGAARLIAAIEGFYKAGVEDSVACRIAIEIVKGRELRVPSPKKTAVAKTEDAES